MNIQMNQQICIIIQCVHVEFNRNHTPLNNLKVHQTSQLEIIKFKLKKQKSRA